MAPSVVAVLVPDLITESDPPRISSVVRGPRSLVAAARSTAIALAEQYATRPAVRRAGSRERGPKRRIRRGIGWLPRRSSSGRQA